MMPTMHALNGNMKTVAQNFQDSVSTWFSLKKRFLNLLSKQPLGTEHFSPSKPLDWRKQCFTVSHIFATKTKVRIPTELGPIWVPFEYHMLRKKKVSLQLSPPSLGQHRVAIAWRSQTGAAFHRLTWYCRCTHVDTSPNGIHT